MKLNFTYRCNLIISMFIFKIWLSMNGCAAKLNVVFSQAEVCVCVCDRDTSFTLCSNVQADWGAAGITLSLPYCGRASFKRSPHVPNTHCLPLSSSDMPVRCYAFLHLPPHQPVHLCWKQSLKGHPWCFSLLPHPFWLTGFILAAQTFKGTQVNQKGSSSKEKCWRCLFKV